MTRVRAWYACTEKDVLQACTSAYYICITGVCGGLVDLTPIWNPFLREVSRLRLNIKREMEFELFRSEWFHNLSSVLKAANSLTIAVFFPTNFLPAIRFCLFDNVIALEPNHSWKYEFRFFIFLTWILIAFHNARSLGCCRNTMPFETIPWLKGT